MYKYKYVPYAAYELAMETGNGKKKEAEEKGAAKADSSS